MLLVLDANILVSFFRDNPVKFIISNSVSLDLEFYIPQYAIDELKKNKSGILKYGKINSEQFNEKLTELGKYIKIIPDEELKEFESKAKQFSPHDKDLPYFALAIKLNCPIWSNEPAFKEQSDVEIFNTQNLRDELNVV